MFEKFNRNVNKLVELHVCFRRIYLLPFHYRHLVREAKDSIKQPLQRLVSSVILSAPDRSEYRVKISQVYTANI